MSSNKKNIFDFPMSTDEVNYYRLIIILLSCIALCSCAQGQMPSVEVMLQNLSSTYHSLWRLITAAAYVVGLVFIFQALYHLKIYGELRTMMSSQTSLKTPVTYMVAGASLIYIPVAVNTILVSTFGTTGVNPLSYTDSGGTGYSAALSAILGFVQIVGLVAFVRGWVIVAQAAQKGAHGGMGKGVTHIIGGILAINIVGTRDVLFNTLGIPIT